MDDDYFDGLIEMPLLRGFRPKPTRKGGKMIESRMQAECVRWFRMQYPMYSHLLFAVPNGGYRNPREAGRLKAEGLLAGVADLILLIPTKSSHALCIEMKTPTGQSSEAQKKWGHNIEPYGYDYQICRSFDDFKKLVDKRVKDLAP